MQRPSSNSSRKLTVLSLAAATYFMVSGGPYGVEELVQDAGYKLALVILFLTPLIWSLPTGLMVGELSAALPAEGGGPLTSRSRVGVAGGGSVSARAHARTLAGTSDSKADFFGKRHSVNHNALAQGGATAGAIS